MRKIRLVLGLLWRAWKGRHLPDPSEQAAAARHWLEQKIQEGAGLTLSLLRDAEAAGFAARELDANTFLQLRHSEPWSSLSPTSLWVIERTISDRIPIIVTDVKAYVAIGGDRRVLAVLIKSGRVGL